MQQYNSYIRKFPAVLTAKMTGAKERKYFQVTNAATREAPTVDFGTPAAGRRQLRRHRAPSRARSQEADTPVKCPLPL